MFPVGVWYTIFYCTLRVDWIIDYLQNDTIVAVNLIVTFWNCNDISFVILIQVDFFTNASTATIWVADDIVYVKLFVANAYEKFRFKKEVLPWNHPSSDKV